MVPAEDCSLERLSSAFDALMAVREEVSGEIRRRGGAVVEAVMRSGTIMLGGDVREEGEVK